MTAYRYNIYSFDSGENLSSSGTVTTYYDTGDQSNPENMEAFASIPETLPEVMRPNMDHALHWTYIGSLLSYTDLNNKPTIPTNTNQLTNGAGFITGINSGMVTTALGFTPANAATTLSVSANNVGVSRSFSSSTGFQVSATKMSIVNYSVRISCSLSLTGGQAGVIVLEYSANGSTGWTELSRCENANTGTLTVGLSTVQAGCYNLSGVIPAGYYVRIRTSNTTGTPTYTYVTGQEVIY